ncbi:ABC-three component system protein [Cereibacter sphaeroides]|uniref:ABC-three component system protein n=1 Tax=Cereibacter sphaeroides TaxID=1063 RepID=UPI003990A831
MNLFQIVDLGGPQQLACHSRFNVSEANSVHGAAQSAAGYLYQARLALAECLRYAYSESTIEIAIERLDDVSFEKNGAPLELLQTKHHLKKAGDLSDGSVDLWKTLRVWAHAISGDPSLPGRTRFVLVTTAKAPEGSAAAHLRPEGSGLTARDPAVATRLLMAASEASSNFGLQKSIEAFKGLSPAIRYELVAAIEVLDRAALISDIGVTIEERLRMMAPRGKAALAREQLEGWWWPRICAALQADTPGTISVLEVEQKLDDIRDGLKRDSLPLDLEHVEPSPAELASFDEMRFVKQLQSIGIGGVRLEYAKRDFYRASVQRSRWVRESLLFDDEVGRFEHRLIEEWQPRFAQMCDALTDWCDTAALHTSGQKLYGWVEAEARFPIRSQTVRFLTVGSYQILADDLRVGWHRDFESLHAHVDKEPADV